MAFGRYSGGRHRPTFGIFASFGILVPCGAHQSGRRWRMREQPAVPVTFALRHGEAFVLSLSSRWTSVFKENGAWGCSVWQLACEEKNGCCLYYRFGSFILILFTESTQFHNLSGISVVGRSLYCWRLPLLTWVFLQSLISLGMTMLRRPDTAVSGLGLMFCRRWGWPTVSRHVSRPESAREAKLPS